LKLFAEALVTKFSKRGLWDPTTLSEFSKTSEAAIFIYGF
jgi:hypothetical protein